MAALEHRSLDDGGSETELREDRGEADHHERRTDHAELRGGEQARQDDEHEQPQARVHHLAPADPQQPAERAPGEVPRLPQRGRATRPWFHPRAFGQ